MFYEKKKIVPICQLDNVSSFLQIAALIVNDHKLMKYTNLINSEERLDVYEYISDIIKKEHKDSIFIDYLTNRSLIKGIIMRVVYGSTALYAAKSMRNDFDVKNICLISLIEVSSIIVKTFYKEFPSIKKLQKDIKKWSKDRIKRGELVFEY